MFTSLKNILPRALEKNKVNIEIEKIEKKERAQEIIKEIIGKEVDIIKYGSTLVIRAKHHIIANEIKLQERQIKRQLKEEGLMVEEIKYA